MINQEKSCAIFSKNTPRKFVRLMQKGLKIQTKEKHEKYLGYPMDMDGRKLNIFQELHQKIEATITGWKFTHLNLA